MSTFLSENKRLCVCSTVFAVAFAAEFIMRRFGFPPYAADHALAVTFALIYFAVYVSLGAPVFAKALKAAVGKRFFTEQSLMALASLAAAFTGDFAEAAAVMAFYGIGEALTDYSSDRSRGEMERLMKARVESCKVVGADGSVRTVGADSLSKGDVVLLSSGDFVPADGVISEGSGDFDSSSVTGESVPVFLEKGQGVRSGYVFLGSRVFVTVTEKAENSTAAEIMRLVREAVERKSGYEKFTDRFAAVYTPVMMSVAALVAFACPFAFGNGVSDIGKWVYRAAGFLVAGCPCALVASVPLAYFVAVGRLAQGNVFVKSHQALDGFRRCGMLCLDKTGTVTDGKFAIVDFSTAIDEAAFKSIVATGESFSSHPIAKGIVSAWREHVDCGRASDVRETAGLGVAFRFDGVEYSLRRADGGGSRFPSGSGNQIALMSSGGEIGRVVLSDSLKEGCADMVGEMSARGIRVVMLTGDGEENASAVAAKAGISECRFGMTPVEKAAFVRAQMDSGRVVAFMGDGINDAVSVKAADIGIASGGAASAVVREAGDIIIESGDVRCLPHLHSLCRRTFGIIFENIFFSLLFKLLVALMSFFSIAPMWLCVFADGGVLVLAVLNSLRLVRL